MSAKNLTAKPVTLPRRALTSAEFSQLEDVPPETEWFANIDNAPTRRAYKSDLKEFMGFAAIRTPIELRLITRAHVIAWRKDLDTRNRTVHPFLLSQSGNRRHRRESSPP